MGAPATPAGAVVMPGDIAEDSTAEVRNRRCYRCHRCNAGQVANLLAVVLSTAKRAVDSISVS